MLITEKIHFLQSRFNKLILFDKSPHGTDKFYEENYQENRLTLFLSIYLIDQRERTYENNEIKKKK